VLRLSRNRIDGLDSGAVPDASTINSPMQKLITAYKKVWGSRWKEYWVEHTWCVYDGGEIGSTDVVKIKARSRCASDLNRKI
tara:strand:- start:172 stop:417 length:246 start_codon:yes stop_codon:yes gene_type:complete